MAGIFLNKNFESWMALKDKWSYKNNVWKSYVVSSGRNKVFVRDRQQTTFTKMKDSGRILEEKFGR